MEINERYEVNSQGKYVVGTPEVLSSSERRDMIEKMFSINGWTYTLINAIEPSHFHIELANDNLHIKKKFHLYHGNIRKEDPNRNREEKKIQLGTSNDPRTHFDDAIILGFYVFDNKSSLDDTMVVAWPIEADKNYPANPSLRVNMKTDVMPAKNTGFYVDTTTGKNLVVFRPEFIYYYLEHYKQLHYSNTDTGNLSTNESSEKRYAKDTMNVLLYGVPGCGKSHTIKNEYCNDDEYMERVVFHPDYTYSDFVGQILPSTIEGHIRYKFEPGPFTRILKKAYDTPEKNYFLIIEEINRGNAPAIFGDIFQLLDRNENGRSEYSVSNENISDFVFGNINTKIMLPENLMLLATMNTSDQNVFTLDTAFKRRWTMRMIENNIDACKFANHQICAWNITWGSFVKSINQKIIEMGETNLSNEDHRLGAYFVKETDLNNAELFGEKVLMYLWNDAFKYDHDKVFKPQYRTLDELLSAFVNIGFAVFSDDISFDTINSSEDVLIESDNPTSEQYLEGKNPELVKMYHLLFKEVSVRIPSAFESSVGSLTYAAWKSNEIKKASFADVIIQQKKMLIYTEVPSENASLDVGEQLPIDNHHNHYYRITFDIDKLPQIVDIIEEAYKHLKI